MVSAYAQAQPSTSVAGDIFLTHYYTLPPKKGYTDGMLDIQFIRDNPELVQRKAEEKGYRNIDVKALLETDSKRREQLTAVEELRARRNTLNDEMKGQKPTPEQIETGKALKEDISSREAELKETEITRDLSTA